DALGLVEEDDLLVGVGVDVLVLKVGVELGGDGGGALVGAALEGEEELVGRVDLGVARLLGALLGQAVRADEAGGGEGGLVLGEEDVVLDVRGDDVGEVAALLGDLGADGVGEGDGGEDGEGARGQADEGAAAADLDGAEAGEGHGEGGDVGRQVADDHDVVGVLGDELLGHGGLAVLPCGRGRVVMGGGLLFLLVGGVEGGVLALVGRLVGRGVVVCAGRRCSGRGGFLAAGVVVMLLLSLRRVVGCREGSARDARRGEDAGCVAG
ncbi:hypothetical protein CH063_16078, partial [Colletotrichum higginsianum]